MPTKGAKQNRTRAKLRTSRRIRETQDGVDDDDGQPAYKERSCE